MSKQRLLMASYDTPGSDRDGGSSRLFDLIQFLRQAGWTIDFIAVNGLGDRRHVRALQQAGIAVHDGSVRAAPPDGPAFSEQVETLARTNKYDLALFAFWPLAELYLPILRRVSPETRIVVDSVDLHFLRHARSFFTSAQGDGSLSLLDEPFGSQVVGELNAYAVSDAVLTVSEKEAALLTDFTSGSVLVRAVPQSEDLSPSPLPLTERRGILLLGSFQYPPNVAALEYLCREVLPRVDQSLLASHPVYVVGTGLNERVRDVAGSHPHMKLVGWVPSVLPYFHRARIAVVPLTYGAGTKRKMIQALITATPTVSTSIGAEGLNLEHEEHVLIADDADSFACSVERLLQEDGLWERLAAAGRNQLLKSHSRAAAQERLLRAIEVVLSRPVKPAALPEGTRKRYYQRLAYKGRAGSETAGRAAGAYADLVLRVRRAVANVVPQDRTVVVISKGDESLLELGGRTAWHFPRAESGGYAGCYPADSAEAIRQLEAVRDVGGDYLVLPKTALWWLDHYSGLARHLESSYPRVVSDPDTCVIYSLRREASGLNAPVNQPETAAENRNGHVPDLGLQDFLPGRDAGDGQVEESGSVPPVKLVAFYLPQFHPIPENDRWWGEGFTEWRNVTKAQPLFPGHHQPQLPADLGFYDLRLSETREEQAKLARRYGIHGFCYYHYWFHGKQLLERPFNEVLRSGRPDFPFCLCWANEPWSRRWDGSETDVLQPQSYSAEDDLNHIRWLLDALADPRAITIEGRPVFLVYRADQLPDPARTTDLWRTEVERAGLKGVYLMAVETGWNAGRDATKVGFDAKVLFQPQFSILSTMDRMDVPNPRLRVYDYQKAWPVLANPDPVPYRRYDTVFPNWDNTARKGEQGWVVHNSTPQAYEAWLRLAVERALSRPADQRLVFINAWNEWAEGTHLEPDRKNGWAYLEATLRALADRFLRNGEVRRRSDIAAVEA